MPPRAIASQVASAIESAAAAPVRSWWRSRNSSAIEGGNFGAPPKPPLASSKPDARPATAVSVTSSRLSSPAAPPSPESAEAFSARAAEIRCDSLGDPRLVLRPGLRHRRDQLDELGPGEVRAAVEGLAVGGHEHGHRPAALAGHRLGGRHVDGVDVRPLLAVHLDRDDAAVDHLRHRRVLERLMRHHVAPVARRVPDRQQHRHVPPPRLARTPPATTATSRPGCRRAAAGTDSSRSSAGS